MELLVRRYLERRNSTSSAMSQDLIKEENLRDDLKYYFMCPCEKYRARRHIPWKFLVQVLKIIMITTQLILFGLGNQLVVSYKDENSLTFKTLFVKDYSGSDEDDYSIALYTQDDLNSSLFYVLDQYSQLDKLSLAPIEYGEDGDGNLLPLEICKQFYRSSVNPSDGDFDIEALVETECMLIDPKASKNWKTHNSSFFNMDFRRLVNININFWLDGINLEAIRMQQLPYCFSFHISLTFDNHCHSGQVKVSLDTDFETSECQDLNMAETSSQTSQIVLDCFVILISFTSAVMCTRSIVLAVRLLQRFSRFLKENYNRSVCEDDQGEFLNGWYLLVITSDILAIVGSTLKMQIAKSLTNYDMCSIFLGTATLLSWSGVIRYLGYFEKYNVLILTMRASLPKVLRFTCCASMIFLGYTFCGWIVLGPYHEKFERLHCVAECLFSLVNGDDMYATFAELKHTNYAVWIFCRIYLYTFISLFIYMVLSLFIALINDSYETIKSYQKEGFPLTELHKFLSEDDLPAVEEDSHTNATEGCSLFSCFQWYDGVHVHITMP